jgi:hypothetical protein
MKTLLSYLRKTLPNEIKHISYRLALAGIRRRTGTHKRERFHDLKFGFFSLVLQFALINA